MNLSERGKKLDERLLGHTGITIVCALIAVALAATAVDAATKSKWIVAVVWAVLAVISGQAARRTWKVRAASRR